MSHLLAKAAEKQDLARIDALLDEGADIEWQHKGTGRTPLLSAVIAGKADSVERLLDRGANISGVYFDSGEATSSNAPRATSTRPISVSPALAAQPSAV
ncbi:ankyrin repeat domain-containing protein [Stenotrophomonas maltophilia]|uniref:ankyrin repeat domain-containing protein n=1 Tax=Stenotrophomonas maltophilia TaxID=40324 RepID=UPI002EDA77F8